jgi:hypothetical protein
MVVAHVRVAGNDQVEPFLLKGPLCVRSDRGTGVRIRDRFVVARVPSARVTGHPADTGQEAAGQPTACVSHDRCSQKPAKEAVASVRRVQQIAMFHPYPEVPQLKAPGLHVNPNADSALPEIPKIEIVISFEVVDLYTPGNDPLEMIHDRSEGLHKGSMASDPEVEDVAHEEQVSGSNPGPYVLEKAEQDLCLGLIEPFQVDVGKEVGFRGRLLESWLGSFNEM